MSEVRLDGKVAVVTGAGQGLGRAHARALAERGAQVVVNDLGVALDGAVDHSRADAVVAEITAVGGTAVADAHTVATPEGGQALVRTAIDAFGRIDIVVQNAGFLRDSSFAKLTPDAVRAVLDVHLAGAFWTVLPAWSYFKEQGSGAIVTTSSVAGLLGNFGQANYSAAKMGIVGFTRTLAIEGARYGIRANAISPTARTRMTEKMFADRGQLLAPETVSPLVVWLASDECQASGQVFAVAAGHVARMMIAHTEGVTSGNLTPESLRADWAKIMDAPFLAEPHDIAADFELLFRNLR